MKIKINSKENKDYYCQKCKQFIFSIKDNTIFFPNRVKNLSLNGKECNFKCIRCNEEIKVELKE